MTSLSLSASAPSTHTRIAVIGGGLAGLTAAYRLHERGADVHLYEARGRVGGRAARMVLMPHGHL